MATPFIEASQGAVRAREGSEAIRQRDAQLQEALGWLALQSQVEQRKLQQLDQQKKAQTQAFGMMPQLNAPPPMTPPQAMPPGAPSQPMQMPPAPGAAPPGAPPLQTSAPPPPPTGISQLNFQGDPQKVQQLMALAAADQGRAGGGGWQPMPKMPPGGGMGASMPPGAPTQTRAPDADVLPPNLMTAQQAIELITKNPNIPEEMRYPTLEAMLPIMDKQNQLTIQKYKATTEAKKAGTAAAKEKYNEVMGIRKQEGTERLTDAKIKALEAKGAGGTGAATAFNQEYDKLSPAQQKTVDFYATQQIGGDSTWRTGLGRTAGGSSLIKAVEERVPAVAEELGLSAADVGTNRAKRAANQAALSQITKDLTTIKPFAGMLDQNADILKGLARKIIKTQSPLANKPLNWLQNNAAGDPDVAEFLAQMKLVQVEAARVIQNPRLVGQLTDEAQREIQQIVNGEMSLGATDRVLDRIINDSQRRVGMMEKQRDSLTANIKEQMTGPGGEKSKAPKEAAPPTNAKGWKLHTDKNGNQAYVSPNGKEFEEVK